jgi:hypothetical protein
MTADATGTNGLTCLPNHGSFRSTKPVSAVKTLLPVFRISMERRDAIIFFYPKYNIKNIALSGAVLI